VVREGMGEGVEVALSSVVRVFYGPGAIQSAAESRTKVCGLERLSLAGVARRLRRD
jgi:hypothetical protein